jgi:hypothetical protein
MEVRRDQAAVAAVQLLLTGVQYCCRQYPAKRNSNLQSQVKEGSIQHDSPDKVHAEAPLIARCVMDSPSLSKLFNVSSQASRQALIHQAIHDRKYAMIPLGCCAAWPGRACWRLIGM